MRIACHRCGRPTAEADGVCPTCKARVSPQSSPYWESEWKRRSVSFLRKHTKCALCGSRATVADHYPDTRRELLARGVADPDTEDRLRPLCASCHASRGRRSTIRFDNDPA